MAALGNLGHVSLVRKALEVQTNPLIQNLDQTEIFSLSSVEKKRGAFEQQINRV